MKYSKNNDPSIASYLFLQFVERVVGLSVALCRMPTPSLPHYYNNIEEKKRTNKNFPDRKARRLLSSSVAERNRFVQRVVRILNI